MLAWRVACGNEKWGGRKDVNVQDERERIVLSSLLISTSCHVTCQHILRSRRVVVMAFWREVMHGKTQRLLRSEGGQSG